MNNLNHSARFDIELTVSDIIDGLSDEYGYDFRFNVKGVDLDNQKVLTHVDGTYAVNAFKVEVHHGKLRITIADMPELEF